MGLSESTSRAASLIVEGEELRALTERLVRLERVALDIESNGLFKYRATLCTIQLAGASLVGVGEVPEIAVVDAFAAPLTPLALVLGPGGPKKIVHDVAFDARILAEAGLVLGNVLDTSIAARMLGRSATGLASLLGSELGISMDKKLQHHDWSARPIRPAELCYLADDVAHLGALADVLWSEVTSRGIADAVAEETHYRLAQAIAAASADDPRPPWVRLKGVDRVPAADLPIVRRLAELRERTAQRLDVPPYKVLGADVLFAIARARPRTMEELAKIRGATQGPRARSLAPSLIEAVRAGLDDGAVPAEERVMIERPRLPSTVAKARRAREQRLTSWRKDEARQRGVDEQVVLPGHCLQDLAGLEAEPSLEAISAVPGIGAFRVARDGQAIVAALRSSALGALSTSEAP